MVKSQGKISRNDLKQESDFSRWWDHLCSGTGMTSSPLEFLLFGDLRYLRRGWVFDDVSERAEKSTQVIINFFGHFVNYGSSDFFNKRVATPLN